MVWTVQDDSSDSRRDRQGKGRNTGDREARRGREHGDSPAIRSDEHTDLDSVQEGRTGNASNRGAVQIGSDEGDRAVPLVLPLEADSVSPDLPVTELSSVSSIAHLQRLLTQCGFVVVDPIGSLGPSTKSQIRAFQFAKGLSPTAIGDYSTWHVLIESHWKLGDRLLYLRRPMLRGDDVAQLQGRLSWLGFDPGKVDGIFGPSTQRVLSEFQINVGMAGDGICGPDTIAELERNFGRSPMTITSVKELIKLNELKQSLTSFTIILASGLELSSTAEAARVSLAKEGFKVLNYCHYDLGVLAELCNNSGGGVVVYLEPADLSAAVVSYFQGFHYISTVGQSLATFVAEALTAGTRESHITVTGSRHRILQLTKAPCVVISLDSQTVRELLPHTVSDAIAMALSRWFAEV